MSDAVSRLNGALEGRYAIERELGEGGMATVYLADDIKHHRKVALKVLKPELAVVVGAERFLVEIQVTANLQHPHILPLFDSGEADGFLFYVMPYVEGGTLRDRIDREKQLPVDEAVALASKVAGALYHAHEHGVIHRDIKPGNILIQGGEPVVADFGIALAVGAAGGTRLTETGLSVGTPFYMSPEQATGDQAVGPASDTYALACVLYEMLVGEAPYIGNTAQAVLGKIIAGKRVSATEHRASIPANVDAALRCALEVLPADRFTSAQEFVRALGDEHFRYGELATAGPDGDFVPGIWKRLTMAFAAAFLVGAITVGILWNLASNESLSEPTRRFVIDLPASGLLRPNTFQPLAISRDGRSVIMNMETRESGQLASQIFVRPLESLEAVPIRGTENVGSFFVSPDGEWVAFNNAEDGTFQKVPVAGGPPVTISGAGWGEGDGFRGASWGDGGTIVFATTADSGLWRVPAEGGIAEPLTTPDEDSQEVHFQPHFLPGSETLLFVVGRPGEPDRIAALALASGQYETLTTGSWPHYVAPGRLILLREDALWAVAFDPGQLAVTGEPVPVQEGLRGVDRFFALSGDGTLVYAPISEISRELVWVDRDGRAELLDMEPQEYVYPRVSPQGDRLAVAVVAGNDADLWVFDLDRGTRSRITFGGNNRYFPVWTPAGDRLTFSDGPNVNPNSLLLAPSDGSGGVDTLLAGERLKFPTSWSSDGQTLAYYERVNDGTGRNLWVLPAEGDPEPFLVTQFGERAPTFSPDGRWLAYVSDKSGRYEVYLQQYPGPGSELIISSAGGAEPVWSPDGSELFYRSADQLMVVDLADPARPGTPRTLLVDRYLRDPDNNAAPNYDIDADGQRFVMVRGSAGQDRVVVVLNWLEEPR